MPGVNRKLCTTAYGTPWRRTAASTASACSTEVAIGFSLITATPAAAASIACSACKWCGVAMVTASSSARSSMSR